jgi:hypothetical protein
LVRLRRVDFIEYAYRKKVVGGLCVFVRRFTWIMAAAGLGLSVVVVVVRWGGEDL